MRFRSRSLSIASACLGMLCGLAGLLYGSEKPISEAEAKIVAFLHALDRNGDGLIQSSEVSDSARPYLERIAMSAGMDIEEGYTIEQWLQARVQYQRNVTSGQTIKAHTTSTKIKSSKTKKGIRSFGIDAEQPVVPGFGTSAIKWPFTQDDENNALSLLQSYDGNGDGAIDRMEAKNHGFGAELFEFDFNRDKRVNRLELAQRYAKQRLARKRDSAPTFAVPPVEQFRSSMQSRFRRTRGESETDTRSRSLANNVVDRYDRDRNGYLDETERGELGFPMGQVDFDRDGLLKPDEIATWLYRGMQIDNEDLTRTLPIWFFENDENGDQQIQMSEFSDSYDENKLSEFNRFDTDRDGIITAGELLESHFVSEGRFAMSEAVIIEPSSSHISEIEIVDDCPSSDLKVRLSITHDQVGQLDLLLIGPDGLQIQLCSASGAGGAHFDQTVFSDTAETPIKKGRPPFRGTFQPSAKSAGKPSLSHYRDKNLKGVWKLVVRAQRSDTFCVLHHWSLLSTPPEDF